MKLFQCFAAIALLASLAACGSTNKSCKDACDKISSCSLNSSGLSCDQNCGSPDDQCAGCLNDNSCQDIAQGKCANDCPNATFTP